MFKSLFSYLVICLLIPSITDGFVTTKAEMLCNNTLLKITVY